MSDYSLTGADLTHLDQYFLVIVRSQGHDTSITYLNIIGTSGWGICQWQYLLYF